MEEIKVRKRDRIMLIALYLLTPISGMVSGFLYGLSTDILVRNSIFIIALTIGLFFTVENELKNSRFRFDNFGKLYRFFWLYMFGLLASCLFPLVLPTGWPYLVIFISLSLFSSELTGLICGIVLLTNSFLLTGSFDAMTFLAFLIPAVVSVLLFSSVDDEFKVGVPLGVSIAFQFVCLSLVSVLLSTKTFSFWLFLYPLINIAICFVVILIVLKIFSYSLVYKANDRFLDIIDPEFELIVQLKEKSKEDYNHTIYTSVLCAKIASNIGINPNIAKACGLYHRIGLLLGENTYENVCILLDKYEVPTMVRELLKEYLLPGAVIKSKEIVVLMFADTVISSVKYLFSKDPEANIDYDKLINAIFDKKIGNGVISDSKISYEDINIMKRILIDDKLFYDFLR